MEPMPGISTFSGQLITIMHENGNDPEAMKQQVREHLMNHVETKLSILEHFIGIYGKYSIGNKEEHEKLVEDLHEFVLDWTCFDLGTSKL